ncbi:MAG: anthranilate synthase component I family protein [Chloroflexi bacterium]|nr:anthranilate synthase component I family protein [Chloroflexota bacterium]
MSGPIPRLVSRRPFMPPVSLHAARASDIVPRIHANGQSRRMQRIDGLPPLRLLADGFRDLPGLAVLEGGSDLGGEGRWSYLAAEPFDTVRWTSHGVVSEIRGPLPGNGFSALDKVVPRVAPTGDRTLPPFTGGAIGYIAYDAAYELEVLPGRCPGPVPSDLMRFGVYDWVLARDAHSGDGWIVATPHGGRDPDDISAQVQSRLGVRESPARPPAPRTARTNAGRRQFGCWVTAVKDYIAAGDCYQVNVARRIEFDAPEPGLEMFQRLAAEHPSPFGAYLDADGIELASSSPELFLRVDPNGHARTRPIKGTTPRGATRALDAAAEVRLRTSPKDRAENVMIVDVLRNDFGRVCRPGSISVPELWQTEALPTVWQLVSEVRGELGQGIAAAKLLEACWPGGSITGAPKIRASEIIDELEPVRRGAYCGSVFALGFDGGLTASLAIRTVQRRNGVGHLHVGAGIVAESDADLEYAETQHKARGVLRALGASEDLPA